MAKKKPIKPTPSLESIISIEELTVDPIEEETVELIVETASEPIVETVTIEPQKVLQPHEPGFWDFHDINK